MTSVEDDDRRSEPRNDAPDPNEARAESPSEETGLVAVDAATDSTSELEALRRDHDALAERLLRVRAEFDNYRKRVERDRQQVILDAQSELLSELISTLDNLEHALKADTTYETLYSGVELIQRDLLACLSKIGLSPHDPTGRPFDPTTDEALSHENIPGYDEGIVVECFRKGYLFRDRLLRPAWVKVARGDETTEGQSDKGNDKDNATRT